MAPAKKKAEIGIAPMTRPKKGSKQKAIAKNAKPVKATMPSETEVSHPAAIEQPAAAPVVKGEYTPDEQKHTEEPTPAPLPEQAPQPACYI